MRQRAYATQRLLAESNWEGGGLALVKIEENSRTAITGALDDDGNSAIGAIHFCSHELKSKRDSTRQDAFDSR